VKRPFSRDFQQSKSECLLSPISLLQMGDAAPLKERKFPAISTHIMPQEVGRTVGT
jgi:hypothetical protein